MGQKERLRVWKGELRRTAGGLKKSDLAKNKRGKIVSLKKSQSSRKENNLKDWLRTPGQSFAGKLKNAGKPLPAKKGKSKLNPPKPKPKLKPQPPQKKKKASPKKAVKKAPVKKAPVKKAPVKKAPVKKVKVPGVAGQHKDVTKVTIGNILVKKKQKLPANWPAWAKKVATNREHIQKQIVDWVEIYEDDDEKPDWAEIKMEILKANKWLKKIL
jgi:hypothetical protein